ncbi:tRNA 2-thiouridine(34) synthase MnmA [Candidatus Kaiserbacteria bacterium]|nr:MAG: tRNA 2-thiouridine(34) synthase MnmA [Candidatus Kaiserbacteria bacterium]
MKKVFVALSGGVDSSVVAHILQSQGWDVTAVFIRVWQPDFMPCTQDEEERAALRVAASLGIPFRRLDLSDEYKKGVVDTMISEYRAGRTPNPDVLCNAEIKFGAFLKYAKREGANKIATGHHARVHTSNDTYTLLRGVDETKDQAYFLWKLTQEELSHTLMPVGEMSKTDVREYAEKHALPSAHKPDSQGLCFIGHVDMKTFLKNFIEAKSGRVLDENGKTIGNHEGIEFVTLGQRGGFTITDKDAHGRVYYVVQKDAAANTITVSTQQNTIDTEKVEIKLTDTNWLMPIVSSKEYTCEIRYHGLPIVCTVEITGEHEARVHTTTPILVAKGQSVVVYEKDVCFGGGVVA